jgi:biotin operon repressor
MPVTKYPGLIEFVKNQLENGKDPKKIYPMAVRKFGYEEDLYLFYNYCYKVKMRHMNNFVEEEDEEDLQSDEEKLMKILKKDKVISGEEICEELSARPSEVFGMINELRSRGHEIIVDDGKVILTSKVASKGDLIRKPLEDTEIIFGVASDLHFGSKHCQITALNEFAHICYQNGVKYIFCPGDICAGFRVYRGQEFENYAITAQEQEESVIVNLPEGFEWYMIGGNHDYSFIKTNGHNPLLTISHRRPDVHYIGYDEGDVPILPGIDLKMWHPSGGVPYSYSYRAQKGIEQIVYGEMAKLSRNFKDKPSIRFLLIGHLHIQLQAMFGSIFGMQCGTFEGQTNYLKRKGLYPQVGGYIVKADIAKNGLLRNFSAKFYMFPFEIEEDYKNYNHTIDQSKIKKPIFS